MNIFLTAGGTGGHIFPAVAFGQWLGGEKNTSSIYYICGNRSLELEIYRHSGIEPLILPIEGSPFGISSFFNKIKRTFNMLRSCIYMFYLIKKFKPDACFMFGGYVSFPALLACTVVGVPVVVHEQNAVAGRVVRLAQKIGKLVVKSWNSETSNVPVREFLLWGRQAAFEKLDISNRWIDSRIIGIFGGSLTSRALINVLHTVVKSFPDDLFLVLSEKEGIESKNALFIGRQWDINPVLSIVDLVVCRGGASTLAELEAYNISTVVVPWEKSSDDHQAANAERFSEITGNYVLRENQDAEQLIRLISLSFNRQREKKSGAHDQASLNLFRAFEDKYGTGRKYERTV